MPSVQTVAEYVKGAGTVMTVAHTTRDGGNRLLLANVHSRNIGAISSVTYNGVAMTLVSNSAQGAGTGSARRAVAMYYMVAPPVGTHNLVMTCANDDGASINVVNVVDADQSTPFRDQSGNQAVGAGGVAANSTLSPASAVGDLVFDAITVASTPTIGGSQTLVTQAGSVNYSRESSRAGQAGSMNMSWAFASDEYGHAAVAIQNSATSQPDVADYEGARGKKSLVLASRLTGESVANTTVYCAISPSVESSGDIDRDRIPARVAGTYSDPFVRILANTGTTDSVFTLMQNGVATGVVVTVSAGQTGLVTGAGSITVDGATELGWRWVGPTSGSITVTILGLAFNPSGSETQSILGAHSTYSYLFPGSTNAFVHTAGTNQISTSEEVEAERQIPFDATWRGLHVRKALATLAAVVDVRSRINRATGQQALQWASGENGDKEDTTHADSVLDGDRVALNLISGAGAGSWEVQRFTTLLLNAAGEFLTVTGAGAGIGYPIGAAGAYYLPLAGEFFLTTTESEAQVVAPFNMVLKRLFVDVGQSTSTGCTFRLRINGVNGNQFVLAKAGFSNTYYADLWETDEIAAGDLLCFQVVYAGVTNGLRIKSVGIVGIETQEAGGVGDTPSVFYRIMRQMKD